MRILQVIGFALSLAAVGCAGASQNRHCDRSHCDCHHHGHGREGREHGRGHEAAPPAAPAGGEATAAPTPTE